MKETNTNATSNLSLRGAERLRGVAEANPEIPCFARNKLRNPLKNEIATPFGLAMTTCGIKIFNAFVLVRQDEIILVDRAEG